MDGILEAMLKVQDGQLLIPVSVAVVIYAGIKVLAGLQHSRGSTRREFLELMRDHAQRDDLWLSVAVRHQFGAYLPVKVIRKLLLTPQPARALLEVGESWELVDLNDETGELSWRKARHAVAWKRRWIARGHLVGYFVTAFCSLMLGYLLIAARAPIDNAGVWWVYVGLGVAYAVWSLHRRELLKNGSEALERWLGVC